MLFILRRKMGNTALGAVCRRSTEFFKRHVFASDSFDHSWPGDEHVAGAFYHEDEVRQCRRIYRSACTGTHNSGNLRDHARSQDIAEKDLGISTQSCHTLLDASSSRIVKANYRRSNFHG